MSMYLKREMSLEIWENLIVAPVWSAERIKPSAPSMSLVAPTGPVALATPVEVLAAASIFSGATGSLMMEILSISGYSD